MKYENYEVKKQILDKIKEYNRILIFRHKRPDGDATGSTKGLKRILELTYPEKEIKLQNCDFADYMAFLGARTSSSPRRPMPTHSLSFATPAQWSVCPIPTSSSAVRL